MINLNCLAFLHVYTISSVLFTNSNYKINSTLNKRQSFNFMGLLEESHSIISRVFQKYYLNVINITSNLFSSLLSSTFWHNNLENEKEIEVNERKDGLSIILKKVGLFLSLIVFILVSSIWFAFKPKISFFQGLPGSNSASLAKVSNLDVGLGVDGLSLSFVLLIGVVLPIVYWSNWSTITNEEATYILIIVLLELFLLIVFLVIDLVMFYVFFESILPPLFLLIGLYGASQKFRAGYYLFLYTLMGSLFMLLAFMKVGGDAGSAFFEATPHDSFYLLFQELIWLILFFSFSVKTPLVPVHIWLPLAHSDANVSGSIILASIVLKLALYGFIRILINIFSSGTTLLTPFFLMMCGMSVLYASSTTMRQFDLKVIVAYSSIAHMASSLFGTFSDNLWGLVGSIVFGLAHGFVSPGLFILVGAVLYDKCGSRIINYYRGLTDLNPVFAIIFLLFIFGNMSVPLTGNFIGEFLSLLGSYQQSIFITTLGATSIILSAVYSIFTYNRVASGVVSPYIFTIPDMYRKEFYMILPLLLLTLALGIYPSFITSDIEFALSHSLLFSLSPVIFSRNERAELPNGGNPHNTPIIDSAVPPAPATRNRYPNNDNERPSSAGSDQSTLSESSDSESNGGGVGHDPNYVGNPISDEGRPLFVPLQDRRNQPVDAGDLQARLQGVLNSRQANGEESNADLPTDPASYDRTNSNTPEEERVSSGIRNREEIEDIIPVNTPANGSVNTLLNIPTNTNTPANTPVNTNTPTNTPVNTSTPTNTPINTAVNSDDENEEETQTGPQGGTLTENKKESQRENWKETSDNESDLEEWSLSDDTDSTTSENYLERHSGRRNGGKVEQESELVEDRDNNSNDSSNLNYEAQGIDNKDNNKEVSEKDKDLDYDSDFSGWSSDSINSQNYLERHSGKRNRKENEEETTRSNNDENNNSSNNNINENNNISNNNSSNNNCSNKNIIPKDEYISELPKGDLILISDDLFYIAQIINNMIFYFSNITSMQILLLVISLISYYRLYLLWVSLKESLSLWYIILKLRIK